MLLHYDGNQFKNIVNQTARYFGVKEQHIEKDYFFSLLLKEIVKVSKDYKIVFKGGTSLSKCYGLIKRFSEDIDLAVLFEGDRLTSGMRKKLKNIIVESICNVNLQLTNMEELKSRREYNLYKVLYNENATKDTEILKHILVETIVVYKPYPVEEKKVSNYIYDFLNKNSFHEVIEKYDMKQFDILVQTYERTLIDKLFAMCDYYLENKAERYSRHLYDVHKIWEKGNVDTKKLKKIIPNIVKDRQSHGNRNPSVQVGIKPNEILNEIIEKDFYKIDFNNITKELIFEEVEYKECIKSLKEIIKSNILPKIIDN